jgi:hypothetical protein
MKHEAVTVPGIRGRELSALFLCLGCSAPVRQSRLHPLNRQAREPGYPSLGDPKHDLTHPICDRRRHDECSGTGTFKQINQVAPRARRREAPSYGLELRLSHMARAEAASVSSTPPRRCRGQRRRKLRPTPASRLCCPSLLSSFPGCQITGLCVYSQANPRWQVLAKVRARQMPWG